LNRRKDLKDISINNCPCCGAAVGIKQDVDDSGWSSVFTHGLDEKEYEITYVHSGLGMADNYVALAITPAKICGVLNCDVSDIMEMIPDNNAEENPIK